MSVSRRRAAYATFVGSAFNTILVSLQALFLLPLYLAAVGPRLYGAWLAGADLLIWLNLIDFGIPNVLIQRVAAALGRGDRRSASEWFLTGSAILLVAGVLAALIGAALGGILSTLFDLPAAERQQFKDAYVLAAVATGISLFVNAFIGLSRAIQQTLFMSSAVLAGTLVGFIVSLLMVMSGSGLWAVAVGLLARALIVLTGGIYFGVTALRRQLEWPVSIRGSVLREAWTLVPVTTVAGLSYSAMNQSEVFFVATLFRPELAVVYSVTRKGAEVGRMLVDMVAFGSYGGFAHLAASAERARARSVYGELLALRSSLAIAIAAAYVALNASFVSLWVGEAYFGGAILTAVFGIQLVATGGSYMLNYLYRAMGHLAAGAGLLLAEALGRVPLMIAFLLRFGLPGVPLAAIISALVAAPITDRLVTRDLPPSPVEVSPSRWIWIVRLGLLFVAIIAGTAIHLESWPQLIGCALAIGAAFGSVLIFVDPSLRVFRQTLRTGIRALYSPIEKVTR